MVIAVAQQATIHGKTRIHTAFSLCVCVVFRISGMQNETSDAFYIGVSFLISLHVSMEHALFVQIGMCYDPFNWNAEFCILKSITNERQNNGKHFNWRYDSGWNGFPVK